MEYPYSSDDDDPENLSIGFPVPVYKPTIYRRFASYSDYRSFVSYSDYYDYGPNDGLDYCSDTNDYAPDDYDYAPDDCDY